MTDDPGSRPDDARTARTSESAAVDAMWEWHLPSGELVWARGFESGFGHDSVGDADWWTDRVHPEERERVQAELASRADSAGTWETTLRFCRGDGTHVDVSLRAEVVGSDGEPERLVGTMVALDDRRRTRRALEERVERYRTLVEQDLVGIGLSREGEFLFANPGLAAIYGHDREELLGMDPAALIPEGARDEAFADAFRLVEGEIDEATIAGPVARGDGETAYVQSYLTRTDYRGEEAFLSVTVDVTDRIEAERALEASERVFQAVFEAALDGIVIFDDDGVHVDANRAACEIFGLERDALVGAAPTDLEGVDVEFDFDLDGGLGYLHETGADRGGVTLVRPDGERRIVEYASTADILPDRHLAILRDVTGRERQEAALAEERARLDLLNAMLRHHVLNGMNIVLATTEHLAADAEGDRLDRLETIRERGSVIVELVGTIRSLVNTIQTSEATGFEPTDLSAVLARSVETARATHEDAAVSLDGAGDDVYVYADPMLEAAFDAVLENAIVHDEADEPEVEVSVEADGEAVAVHVADDGPGVPPGVRDDLLEGEFGSGGSGFGLNVAHLLVSLYGGELRIRDREPHGTVVTLEFPRARPPAAISDAEDEEG